MTGLAPAFRPLAGFPVSHAIIPIRVDVLDEPPQVSRYIMNARQTRLQIAVDGGVGRPSSDARHRRHGEAEHREEGVPSHVVHVYGEDGGGGTPAEGADEEG